MFGQMRVEPVVPVALDLDTQTSIATLIKVAENVEIQSGMEFPNSLLSNDSLQMHLKSTDQQFQALTSDLFAAVSK